MNYTSGTQAGSGVIDDLQFITEPGRNRILRINEQANDLVFKLKGFRPKTEANGSTSTGGIDYGYDANGNQTSDPHKGITSIQYNYLNLPSLITYADGRKIEQRYDATGNLIFRWMTGSANSYFQTYVYGTEYRGATIESVAHQEGRLYNTNVGSNTAVWRYEYNITDHLGNTRLTFADKTPDGVIKIEDGEVLEEAHYYPFGLAMEGPWINDAAALDTRYKFNGIERVQDFGLNMDMAMYRSYDPAIGRWWQIDPLAALAPEQTPYRFGFNSPMNFSDPLGLFEKRRDARNYMDDNGYDSDEFKVRKQKDGSFAIVNRNNGNKISKNSTGEVTFTAGGKRGDPGSRQGSISNYTPTFWDKARESSNFFAQLGYGLADGFYTYFQEMNPLNTQTTHLGHGLMTQNEKQDLAVVHASVLPMGRATSIIGNSTESVFASLAKKAGSKVPNLNPAFSFAKNRVPAGETWVDVITGKTYSPGTFTKQNRPYLQFKKNKPSMSKTYHDRSVPWTSDKDPIISPKNKVAKILEVIFSQWE